MRRTQRYTRRIRAGHSRAWTELHRRFYPRLKSYFTRRDLAEQADDLASDVIAVTWKKRSRLRTDRPIAAWLFAVAHNLCKRAKRRQTRDQDSLDDTPQQSADESRAEARRLIHEELALIEESEPVLVARGRVWLQSNCDTLEAASQLNCSRRSVQASVAKLTSILQRRLRSR